MNTSVQRSPIVSATREPYPVRNLLWRSMCFSFLWTKAKSRLTVPRTVVPGGSLRGMNYAAPASRVTLFSVRSDLPKRM